MARILARALVVVLLLAAFAAAFMRLSRGRFSGPTELKPGMAEVVVGNARAHVIAARTESGIILFDAGTDPQGKAIDALLASMHGARDDVHQLFLTHGHWDHIAGAAGFPKAKTYAGAADVDLAAGRAAPEARVGRVLMLASVSGLSIRITDPLTGIQDIEVAPGKAVRAIPMPGHTPGSYAFLYDGVLIVGDTMLAKDGNLGPPLARFDMHPAENGLAVLALKMPLAGIPIDRVCTAHGGCTRAGEGSSELQRLWAWWSQ